jgi:hypothetical protein
MSTGLTSWVSSEPEMVVADNLSAMACMAGLGGTDRFNGSRDAMDDESERTGWMVGVPGVAALISGELELEAAAAAVASRLGGLLRWGVKWAWGFELTETASF